MKFSPINSRIAARLHQAQLDLADWSDALASRVGSIYGRALQSCVEAATDEHQQATRSKVHSAIQQAHHDAYAYLQGQYTARIHSSHNRAADALMETVPLKWWRKILPLRLQEDDEPVLDAGGDDDQRRQFVRENLFPPLDGNQVSRIINSPGANGITWPERMQMLTKLADPDTIARHLEDGLSAGENTAELRERIRPDVNDYAVSAQRIARTEGGRIASQAQWTAFKGLGGMMSGRQRIATIDQFSRPDHAAANGKIYKYDGRGEVDDDNSFADDGGEKFPGDHYAPNCRCLSSPVLSEPAEIQNDPLVAADFANAEGAEIPDPAAYTEWFAGAGESARKDAVGVKRYAYMTDKLTAYALTPTWNDFLDPEDGSLMPLKALKAESAKDHVERREAVDKLLLDRQMKFIKVAKQGFLPSPPPVLNPEKKVSRKRKLERTT